MGDRVALGLLVPMAATVLAVLLIAGIGNLLLFVAENFPAENELYAVGVALALGGVVLVACALAARGGRREHTPTHH